MKRIIVIITLILFVATNMGETISYHAYSQGNRNLAPSLIFDDLGSVSPHHKNIAIAEIFLAMELLRCDTYKDIDGVTDAGAIKTVFARMNGTAEEETVFRPARITVSYNDLESLGGNLFAVPVVVRRSDDRGGDEIFGYRFVFSTARTADDCFPAAVCTDAQLDAIRDLIAETGRMPVMGDADDRAIMRYKQHEVTIDRWIAGRMGEPGGSFTIPADRDDEISTVTATFASTVLCDFAAQYLNDFYHVSAENRRGWITAALDEKMTVLIRVAEGADRPVIEEDGRHITVTAHTSRNARYLFLDAALFDNVTAYLREPAAFCEAHPTIDIAALFRDTINPILLHEIGVDYGLPWQLDAAGNPTTAADTAYQIARERIRYDARQGALVWDDTDRRLSEKLELVAETLLAGTYTRFDAARQARDRDYAAGADDWRTFMIKGRTPFAAYKHYFKFMLEMGRVTAAIEELERVYSTYRRLSRERGAATAAEWHEADMRMRAIAHVLRDTKPGATFRHSPQYRLIAEDARALLAEQFNVETPYMSGPRDTTIYPTAEPLREALRVLLHPAFPVTLAQTIAYLRERGTIETDREGRLSVRTAIGPQPFDIPFLMMVITVLKEKGRYILPDARTIDNEPDPLIRRALNDSEPFVLLRTAERHAVATPSPASRSSRGDLATAIRAATDLIPAPYYMNGIVPAACALVLRAAGCRGTAIVDGRTALIFSEKVTFDNGLGILLPRLVKAGIRIAVIATDEHHRRLIDQLNEGEPEERRIMCDESVAAITGRMKAARYYYFKVSGDPGANCGGVTTLDITQIVRNIVEAIGKICGIVNADQLEKMHDASRKFAEAA